MSHLMWGPCPTVAYAPNNLWGRGKTPQLYDERLPEARLMASRPMFKSHLYPDHCRDRCHPPSLSGSSSRSFDDDQDNDRDKDRDDDQPDPDCLISSFLFVEL